MKEQPIQSRIINHLSTKGYVIKIVGSSRSCVPDVFALVEGTLYAFEIKRSSSEQLNK